MPLSYWIKLYDISDNILWEGMVYGRDIGEGKISVHRAEAPREFIMLYAAGKVTRMEWEPMWEDVTPPRKLLSSSSIQGDNND